MRTEILHPLRLPQFRRVWAGQALSSLGDGVFPVVLAAAVLKHGSAADLGVVLGAESLLLVCIALFGGVLADRMRRSRGMIIADLIRLLATAGFALGGAEHSLVVPVLLAMAMGLGTGLFRPASQALLPNLAPGLVTQANALQSLTSRAGLIAGPALGALLFATAGSRAAFWFDAGTYLVSVLTLLGITDSRPERTGEAGVLAEAREGIRAVLRRPWVATIIGQGTLQLIFVMAPALVLLPIYLNAQGRIDSYGLMVGMQAAGSATGGLLVGIRRPHRPGLVGVLGLSLVGLQLLAMLLELPLPLLAGAMFLTGTGYAMFGVLWASGLQTSIPGELLGRVFAVEILGTYALEPVGLSAAPIVAGHLGLRPVLIVAVAVLVVTTVFPLFVPGVLRFADPVHAAGHEEVTQPVR